MAFNKFDLQAIGASGAGFSVDGARFNKFDLQAIASSVAAGGGQLKILNADRFSKFDLQAIAASGQGHVFFELEKNK